MRIAVIGPGAMGMLFGGYLSKKCDVILVGRNPLKMSVIQKNGVVIKEKDDVENVFYPQATADTEGMSPVDLVILFVKAGESREALEKNRHLIGEDTVLMTLQNGVGHEAMLQEFAPSNQIIIGTTQQGSYKTADNAICHSGGGDTAIGAIVGESQRFEYIAKVFEECGFACQIATKVKGMIWNKLMINASSSVLSGVLQTTQGYVVENEYAWDIAKKLIGEICAVANADGYYFDESEQIQRIEKHLKNAPNGYTSIYADLKEGRKTEVSVINGAVVREGYRLGIEVSTHELMVSLVRAMEGR